MRIPELVYKRLTDALQNDAFWGQYWPSLANDRSSDRTLHLAVFVEPFLTYLLEGRKTVESRFSVHRTAPYKRACVGDILLLKASGGPIVGVCRVTHVWYYELDTHSWDEIRNRFAAAICAEGTEFWDNRASAGYATLLRIADVRSIAPVPFPKRDRRGWVVLSTKADG